MERDNNRKYSNKDIEVFWEPKKCIHASTCYIELIGVFNPSRRPWVNMEDAPTEKIIEVVNKCPTEALMWRWLDEGKNSLITEQDKNHIKIRRPAKYNELIKDNEPGKGTDVMEVRIMKDGPVVVEGNFRLITSEGKEIKTGEFASFCRCGQSNSMPFCDGMHRKAGFIG
ncbi:MAG: (4Fe-4S)-binding protein [Bacteroidales bacterium]|nr:(4Fe-4S)-binding protein [Bacteroidales bacterium]